MDPKARPDMNAHPKDAFAGGFANSKIANVALRRLAKILWPHFSSASSGNRVILAQTPQAS
jgi:hypothetical protein